MTASRYLADGTPNPKYKPGSSGKSGKSGSPLSRFDKAQFCAWDGEGAKVNGKHEYILLANSEKGELVNGSGLSTHDCLYFIAQNAMRLDPRTIHVWFVGSYDVNMMLRDVCKEDIARLWSGLDIDYHRFNIYYRHRKELRIRVFDPDDKWEKVHGRWQRKFSLSVTMWDVFGYFQTRFTQAIKDWYGDEFSKEELQSIEENKAKRSEFTPNDMPEIIDYCRKELKALVLLCERLQLYLSQAGLVVSRWDGAGSVAAALLRREKVKQYIGSVNATMEPLYARAYAGGRIELVKYGYTDKPIYTYDVRSAYPYAMQSLPDMANGRWIHVDSFDPSKFGIWKVHYNNGNNKYFPLHPLFYRDKRGMIYYPFCTNGWFWTPEVHNAVLYWPEQTFVSEGWVFEPSTDIKPFSFVPKLYELRNQWKQKGIGAQMVLKLGLNSLYGKMAQQVGARDGNRPPFHNLAWAGWVTSTIRAKLYRAAMESPQSIIFMATDGIASTKPLDIDVGSRLGQWEDGKQAALLAVQSGVYFYWRDTRTEPTSYYRGFDKGQLTPHAIMDAYARGSKSLTAKSTRFVGMGTALSGEERWKEWREWKSIDRTLNLTPMGTKRYDHWESEAWTLTSNPSLRLFDTIPTPLYEGNKGNMSHPYPIKWLGEDWEEQYLDGVKASQYEAECEDGVL